MALIFCLLRNYVGCRSLPWVVALAYLPSLARGSLVINEFLPDPQGSDSGQEFVEIFNAGQQAVDLLGVSLEFANGIEGAVWSARWTCQDHTVLQPGQRFLIVDRNWQAQVPGQAEVWLGLQNGPDAIRLSRAELVLDMVGYGPLTDQMMMEGSPVPVTSGLSLARRPDGLDTDDNSLDFISHFPTPGQPNFRPYDLELIGLEIEPPSLDRAGGRVSFSAELKNIGTEYLPAMSISLVGLGSPGESLLDASQPGQTRVVNWFMVPTETGRWHLQMVSIIPTTGDTLTVAAGQFQVGVARIFLNEVLPAPGAGQGEWIELGCRGEDPEQLSSYQVRDQDGDWLDLPEVLMQPGNLVVLAQDQEELLAWHSANRQAGAHDDCSSLPLGQVLHSLESSWPTLNNSPSGDRNFADRVYLGYSDTVVDHVTFGEPEAGGALSSGNSWERIATQPTNPTAGNWSPCTSLATGTPGCANSVSLPASDPRTIAIIPSILDPDSGIYVQHIRFLVSAPAEGWWLRIFNTWGELVRDMGGDQQGPGPRDLIWDGLDDNESPVSEGAYVVLLQIQGADGKASGREKALTVVRRRGRQ